MKYGVEPCAGYAEGQLGKRIASEVHADNQPIGLAATDHRLPDQDRAADRIVLLEAQSPELLDGSRMEDAMVGA